MKLFVVLQIAALALAAHAAVDAHAADDGAMGRVTAGAPLMILENGAGEGPVWNTKLGLLFSGDGNVHRLTPSGEFIVHREGAGTNGLYFDPQGRLIACEAVRRRVTRTELDGTQVVLTDRYEGKKYNQPNDVAVDSQGRIYFSDPRYGDRSDMQQVDRDGRAIEGVYRIDPSGEVTRIITHEVDRPNGLIVTAGDRYLFVADNNNNDADGARKLWRFELLKDGTVDFKTQTLIHDWKTSRGPDGMTLDDQGNLYVAGGLNKANPPAETNDNKGGVYVFSPEGKLLEFIPIPRDEVTNCEFGDDDLKSLYVTAGGTLWRVRMKHAGLRLSP